MRLFVGFVMQGHICIDVIMWDHRPYAIRSRCECILINEVHPFCISGHLCFVKITFKSGLILDSTLAWFWILFQLYFGFYFRKLYLFFIIYSKMLNIFVVVIFPLLLEI